VDAHPSDEWPDPDRSDAEECPPSIFPGAGRRVDEDERLAALDAESAGNAEIGDMVDTDEIDSRAHDRPAEQD
jgi:hypothetical protein